VNIIRLSIDRPIFITMVTAFFIALGLVAMKYLPIDLYPDVSYPVLVVRADLSGAAPEEIEQLITKPMEDALSTLSGLKTLRSISREGEALVIMEFDSGVDVRFQDVQVRGKIGNLRRSLPDAMTEPAVFRQDPDDTPIIEVAVTGNRSPAELTHLADDVIGLRLRQIEGVGEVDLEGERTREVQVELSRKQLDKLHLNPQDVVAAIQRFNHNDPVGQLQGTNRVWLARSVSASHTTADLKKIPVTRAADGRPVFLADIADVVDGFAEVTHVTRFGDHTGLKAAVRLNVLKQSGENTVAISTKIREALQQLKKDVPSDVNMTITQDSADLIRSNVADVYESLILGGLLTVLVVLIFLRSPRSTITTGLSLPSSVIATFAIMAVAGFTVNVMTLLALSLAVGLLVDDAIVVRENVFRHLSEDKQPAKEAAYNGAREVQLAVLATTLTVVAVFVPVAFMGGVSGQFFKPFALTVVFAIVMSLWDAMTMAPMLSAYFANIPDPATEWHPLGRIGDWTYAQLLKVEHGFELLIRWYARALAVILPRPWVAFGGAFLAVLLTVFGFKIVRKSFLPAQLVTTFSVHMSGPLALSMNRIAAIGAAAEKRIRNVPGLEFWTVSSGTSHTGKAFIGMTVHIKDSAADDQSQLSGIRNQVRKALSTFPGYTVGISEPADPLAGSSGRFQPIAVMISGDNISTLNDLAENIRQKMIETPGITDVAPIDTAGLPEFVLAVDHARAGLYGVDAKMLSDSLGTFVLGDITNTMTSGEDQVPIRVELKGGEHLTPKKLLALNLYTKPTGSKADVAVPVGNFVNQSAQAGSAMINREQRQRVVRLGANLTHGAALGDVVDSLQGRLDATPLPTGYKARIVGQSEQMAELFGNVVTAVGLGSVFVYMVLASLFESLLLPIAVMIAIPLGATGAVLALILFNMPLDLYGGIGIVLLAGIVAKNSILLVDFAAMRVREKGEQPLQAILEAAPLRLRPIIMTSVAMIAGMIPVAMGLGSGGQARQTLGVATIGGIISSTILTLLIVPSFYVATEKLSGWMRRKRQHKAAIEA